MRNGKMICPICNSDDFHYDSIQEKWVCKNGHSYKGKRGNIGFAGMMISEKHHSCCRREGVSIVDTNRTAFSKSGNKVLCRFSENDIGPLTLHKTDSRKYFIDFLGCKKYSIKKKNCGKFGGISAGKACKKNKNGHRI